MSENNLINTCVWCKKSFDNAMELWDHCMGSWCGEWPDYLKMNTYDHEAMVNIKIIEPDQAEKEESDKSLDSTIEFITHEI